jgi:molybdopterin converting factor small subunit
MGCHVRLRGPLKQRAGGRTSQQLDGGSVGAVLRALEAAHPAVRGWILDERGEVRRHINVYVNGEQARHDSAVADGDVVDVLPAISGGGHR